MRPWPLLAKQSESYGLSHFSKDNDPFMIDSLGFYYGTINQPQSLQNLEQGASLLHVLMFALEELAEELESMEKGLLLCGPEPQFGVESVVLWQEMRRWIHGWIRNTTYRHQRLFQGKDFKIRVSLGDFEECVIVFPQRLPQKILRRMRTFFSKPSLQWEETSDYLCQERLAIREVLDDLKRQQLFFVDQGLLLLTGQSSGEKKIHSVFSEEVQKMAEWIRDHLNLPVDGIQAAA